MSECNCINVVLDILFNMERKAEKMPYNDKRQERLATLREAIRYVENISDTDVQPVDRWISVKDRLPDDRRT